MPFIKVGGVVLDYAVFEDEVKPLWKEQMRKEHQNKFNDRCLIWMK